MTVAHYFTLIRILTIPIFVTLYLHPGLLGISNASAALALIVVYAIGELSDACDGYLARRLGQVTDLGKIIDPMADSLSRLAVYFCFTQGVVQLPLEVPLLMLYRDVSVSTLRTACALKGFALAARPTGKFKAFIQAAVSFTIMGMIYTFYLGKLELTFLQKISTYLALGACFFSLYSGIDYVYANRSYLKRLV